MKRSLVLFLLTLLPAVWIAGVASPGAALAQDERATIDKSRIPAEADNVKRFVPPGWQIEEQIAGDLNGDALPDIALKLVEDKPATDKDGTATERQRALVIVLRNKDGKLSRAAVADKLLQCTRCGGAFYGVVESPANVKIEKGVIIVDQDHGSRNLTNTTYRFRYEPESGKFALIGFDLGDADRLTANVVSESTNYLTGVRIVTRDKGKNRSSRTTIPKKKIYIEQVDSEAFESEASERLKL
jgi:hypothetical protein